MSFAEEHKQRFDNTIQPAIEDIEIGGIKLKARRSDLSKTGDSILTDIVDGISHSRLVLADVSTMGRDSDTGLPYRNSNVMYEVGIALACRQPQDVLLIRNDKDKFLFDVSTIPHMNINFIDAGAKELLQAELLARLREQDFARDARVELALSGLSNTELRILTEMANLGENRVRSWNPGGTVLSTFEMALCRLLDKGVIRVEGQMRVEKTKDPLPAYALTPLGIVAAAHAKRGLTEFVSDAEKAKMAEAEKAKEREGDKDVRTAEETPPTNS
jgi:hypothetical protein